MSATISAPAQVSAGVHPRTQLLLHGRIVPTLLRLAWPSVLVMVAQSSSGLIETWFVSRLGTDALAGMALVFPGFIMMNNLSGGAMGGAISSAIARALGAQRHAEANALVLHALIINVALGLTFSALVLLFGPTLYRVLGGEGGSLEAALRYSNVVFAGTSLVWLLNAFANVIRGTGNMFVPAATIWTSIALQVPLSPCLIFGLGPFPALGIAGGGVAIVFCQALAASVLGFYILSGRCQVQLRLVRLRWALFHEILRVGVVAAITTVQSTLTIALATGLVGMAAGTDAIAGFGTGGRLEYLVVPLVFGLGTALVALVGTNVGAGQRERALRIALSGGVLAFLVTEAIGVAAAIWPTAWLGLFDHDPDMLATGSAYLRTVGPTFGFFGLGLAMYFASQGAGRLFWPLFAGLLRLVIAIGGGWLALRATGSLGWLFVMLSVALVTYGVTLSAAVASGVWFRRAG